MVATKKKGKEFNETQQKAILALVYLTRCKDGKLELYNQKGAIHAYWRHHITPVLVEVSENSLK